MSVDILGRGYIEFTEEVNEELIKLVREVGEMMKNDVNFYDVSIEEKVADIFFDMNGNHNIDYKPLDKIKKFLLKHKVKFTITVNEFVESDNGYWFEKE